MSDNETKDSLVIALTKREVEMVWDSLPRRMKSGRQRYDNSLFRRLGAIADPSHADSERWAPPMPPNPAWLTPEWRAGFAEELKRAGVLV